MTFILKSKYDNLYKIYTKKLDRENRSLMARNEKLYRH
ncbi:hypothetical protein SAMN05444267_100419 [Chryseobacterium polytrichastri]|uniref:Uncharacterized protein n=1 Tax=Chryseobacterium polytrichastri TaxID=1302687 RepID=A0A1M6SG81_9FLAO|nr:hypothetical protein SAMN05444267_100419 [Chryseobacterium polytrichastri]